MIAAIGAASALASTAGSLASSASGTPNANANIGYLPENGGWADQNYQNLFGQGQNYNPIYGTSGYGQTALNQTYQQQLSSPATNYYSTYAPGTAAAYGTAFTNANQVAGADNAAASTLDSNASSLTPYIQQLLTTGFDPQNALYNQEQSANTDFTNADLSARGLNPSGVGAGIADQSNQTFNTNWLNTQLGRESTALSGAQSGIGAQGTAYGDASSLGTTAANLPTSLLNQYLATQQTGTTDQQSALTNYLNALQTGYGDNNTQMSSLLSYLGAAAPNSVLQAGNIQNYNEQQQQQANMGNALGSLGDGSSDGGGYGSILSLIGAL